MVTIVFRSRLRDEHDPAFHGLADRMQTLAEAMPGFVSYRVYVAEDGERCSLIEFESHEHLAAWREHSEHAAAQRLGRERFYESYTLQILEPVRESRFERSSAR